MKEIIGHHTCANDGDGKNIEKQGYPRALAKFDIKSNKNPFLGTGYYFWDYNLLQAIWWGKEHYQNKYYIFEGTIPYDENILDLVGNRQHMEYFGTLYEEFRNANKKLSYENRTYGVSACIEYFKSMGEEQFPFKAIRAIDHNALFNKKAEDFDYLFNDTNKSFVNLNPRIIVCVIDNAILEKFELIRTK